MGLRTAAAMSLTYAHGSHTIAVTWQFFTGYEWSRVRSQYCSFKLYKCGDVNISVIATCVSTWTCLLSHIFEWYDTFHRSFRGTLLRLGVAVSQCCDKVTWNAPCECQRTFNIVYWYEYIFYYSFIYQLCLNCIGCRMSGWKVIVTNESGGMFMFLWHIWRYCSVFIWKGCGMPQILSS